MCEKTFWHIFNDDGGLPNTKISRRAFYGRLHCLVMICFLAFLHLQYLLVYLLLPCF